ncbi:hypothetical protein PAPHI01_2324 [Pancytospora philotis]|nr:hypothetical protein PAPHI01_2324 [Pancytospora philotis]
MFSQLLSGICVVNVFGVWCGSTPESGSQDEDAKEAVEMRELGASVQLLFTDLAAIVVSLQSICRTINNRKRSMDEKVESMLALNSATDPETVKDLLEDIKEDISAGYKEDETACTIRNELYDKLSSISSNLDELCKRLCLDPAQCFASRSPTNAGDIFSFIPADGVQAPIFEPADDIKHLIVQAIQSIRVDYRRLCEVSDLVSETIIDSSNAIAKCKSSVLSASRRAGPANENLLRASQFELSDYKTERGGSCGISSEMLDGFEKYAFYLKKAQDEFSSMVVGSSGEIHSQ